MPKIINTSHTTDTVGLPFLARSVNWLQEKTDEQDIAMIQSNNQNTNTSEVWQLYFKNIRNTIGTTWVWDAGAVLYNAKIYNSDGGTVTLGGGESLVYYFITTAQLGEPTQYTDATDFQTNENIKIGICKNTENVSQQIQAVVLTRYINLEISETGDLNWRLTKRGKVYTFTYTSTLNFNEGRLIFEILKNFSGSFLVSNFDFPVCVNGGSLVDNTATSTYTSRLFLDSGILKANIQSGTAGSISFIA